MDIKDCIKFANENPNCFLATAEGDQPHVRVLGFWFADETGFYFQTGTVKEIKGQLDKNPKAEACFYNPKDWTVLRVEGKVEFLTDKHFKEKAIKDRPFLTDMGFTADSPELVLFRIPHGKAHFWTMENNLKPKEFISF